MQIACNCPRCQAYHTLVVKGARSNFEKLQDLDRRIKIAYAKKLDKAMSDYLSNW